MMANARNGRLKFSDQIRRAIETAGMSRYRIAKETGISQPTLSRFMSGERGLTMKAIDTLADFLGLNIQVRNQPNKRKGR